MAEGRSFVAVASRRGWRTYAAARRRLTRAADSASVAALRRRGASLEAWHGSTSARHAQYRRDHRIAAGSAAIICVSKRPCHLRSVIETVAGQQECDAEFVLVPTGDGWNRERTNVALSELERGRVIWGAEESSLGEALNVGIAATAARFIAKLDDDDHYGPHYLADALRAHGFAGAGVVGKHSYYADVEGLDDRVLRFPGHDFSYASTLAGGTLVIDRERVGDLRFDHVSLGEDRAFIGACHRLGVSTYSADRFNFVQNRGADNTWQIGADLFLAGCIPVDSDAPEHAVDR
ncbi:glycosyltransferase [Ilumatobacter sp.]|uniref:glycosyltransferase n=1 Tax=Ilumatobacter sp. TaxID=1967498 RepID=UPI003AF74B48